MNTETCVVRVVGLANGGVSPHDGRYVVSWNPHTPAGMLELTSTANLAEARHFPWPDVFDQWKTISKREPIRSWDGKPNRPLTGITLEIIRDTPAGAPHENT